MASHPERGGGHERHEEDEDPAVRREREADERARRREETADRDAAAREGIAPRLSPEAERAERDAARDRARAHAAHGDHGHGHDAPKPPRARAGLAHRTAEMAVVGGALATGWGVKKLLAGAGYVLGWPFRQVAQFGSNNAPGWFKRLTGDASPAKKPAAKSHGHDDHGHGGGHGHH